MAEDKPIIKMTPRRREILLTALTREANNRAPQKRPLKLSEWNPFLYLENFGCGKFVDQDGEAVFVLTDKGRDLAHSLRGGGL